MFYKKEILEYFEKNNIPYEHYEHEAVFSVEEADKIALPHKDVDCKNLFVRDDKKKNYFLLTLVDNKSVNLKKFQEINGLRRLSFASSDDLYKYLKITPGSVSPLCLLNAEKNVIFYIDKDLIEKDLIGCHPNDNTATIFFSAKKLLEIIKDLGFEINIFDFNEVKNDN